MLLAFCADLHAQQPVQTWTTGSGIFAKNPNYLPVTVYVDFSEEERQNMAGPVLIRPNAVAKLMNGSEHDGLKLPALNVRTIFGNPFARHSARSYQLPTGPGREAVVSQGTGDDLTHPHRDRYAIDFELEENMPVYAARRGVVVFLKDDSERGGPADFYRQDANYLMILHDDDTLAVYAHLQKNSAALQPGDKVEAGQLLSYSGNTGLSHSPHLHFMVMIPTLDGSYQTLEIPFETKEGLMTGLKTGDRVSPN